MSITIVSAPSSSPGFYSLHRPLVHTVSSTNVTQPDFRFVFDVFIGASVTAAARLKVLPNAASQGVVDVARVVRSFITDYWAPLTLPAPFSMNTNAISIDYQVAYGEEYGGTTYPLTTVASYSAYNCYPFETEIGVNGLSNAPYSQTWATDRDVLQIFIPRNGHGFLSFLNDPSENMKIRVRPVDEDGNPNTLIVYTTAAAFTGLNKLLVLDLNFDVINGLNYATAGTNPMSADIAGYMIWFLLSDGVTETPPAVVRWLCEPKTLATPIHFMNKAGGFDTFHFTAPTRRTMDVDSKNYRVPDVDIQYNTLQRWSRKLSSGYVDDATHNWLYELIASPEIYYEDPSTVTRYPATITTKQWTEKKGLFDKMYNLDIEIKMGKEVASQSR